MYETIEYKNNLILKFKNISRLDILNMYQIKSEIFDLIKKGDRNIILDLDEIQFIDSAAFQALIGLLNFAAERNIEFYVTNMSAEVSELVRLVNLEHTFKNISLYNFVLQ
ncbi:MAG: STAS domain-containing protein [Bacteroidales bacterium]|nr:STAS domain-containing protein [Bacteroidales bacterium]